MTTNIYTPYNPLHDELESGECSCSGCEDEEEVTIEGVIAQDSDAESLAGNGSCPPLRAANPNQLRRAGSAAAAARGPSNFREFRDRFNQFRQSTPAKQNNPARAAMQNNNEQCGDPRQNPFKRPTPGRQQQQQQQQRGNVSGSFANRRVHQSTLLNGSFGPLDISAILPAEPQRQPQRSFARAAAKSQLPFAPQNAPQNANPCPPPQQQQKQIQQQQALQSEAAAAALNHELMQLRQLRQKLQQEQQQQNNNCNNNNNRPLSAVQAAYERQRQLMNNKCIEAVPSPQQPPPPAAPPAAPAAAAPANPCPPPSPQSPPPPPGPVPAPILSPAAAAAAAAAPPPAAAAAPPPSQAKGPCPPPPAVPSFAQLACASAILPPKPSYCGASAANCRPQNECCARLMMEALGCTDSRASFDCNLRREREEKEREERQRRDSCLTIDPNMIQACTSFYVPDSIYDQVCIRTPCQVEIVDRECDCEKEKREREMRRRESCKNVCGGAVDMNRDQFKYTHYNQVHGINNCSSIDLIRHDDGMPNLCGKCIPVFPPPQQQQQQQLPLDWNSLPRDPNAGDLNFQTKKLHFKWSEVFTEEELREQDRRSEMYEERERMERERVEKERMERAKCGRENCRCAAAGKLKPRTFEEIKRDCEKWAAERAEGEAKKKKEAEEKAKQQQQQQQVNNVVKNCEEVAKIASPCGAAAPPASPPSEGKRSNFLSLIREFTSAIGNVGADKAATPAPTGAAAAAMPEIIITPPGGGGRLAVPLNPDRLRQATPERELLRCIEKIVANEEEKKRQREEEQRQQQQQMKKVEQGKVVAPPPPPATTAGQPGAAAAGAPQTAQMFAWGKPQQLLGRERQITPSECGFCKSLADIRMSESVLGREVEGGSSGVVMVVGGEEEEGCEEE